MIPNGTETPLCALDPVADAALLQNIQGNILKAHGRPYSRLVLFWFDAATSEAECRDLVRAIDGAGLVTSAAKQSGDTETAKAAWRAAHPTGPDMPPANSTEPFGNQPFFSVGLSLGGMRRCGYTSNFDLPLMGTPVGFTTSMLTERKALEDVPPEGFQWDSTYTTDGGPHGVWLVAHENTNNELDDDFCKRVVGFLEARGAGHDHACVIEKGTRWTDSDGRTREPFGFVDGLSAPKFFATDFDKTDTGELFVPKWANIPRDQVIIQDKTAVNPNHVHDGGSFLVLRKLEQNIEAFRTSKVSGELLIGRTRDGVPLQQSRADPPKAENPLNNFSFNDDVSRCPFHAHIRKANPRIDGHSTSVAGEPTVRAALLVRRSAVYGYERLPERGTLDPAEAATYQSTDGDPLDHDVGLLFMCYVSSITDQFIVTQENWFGGPRFPSATFPDKFAPLGDPITRPHAMLQGETEPSPWQWNGQGPFTLNSVVTVKGGAYFYMPPISWLKDPPPPTTQPPAGGA